VVDIDIAKFFDHVHHDILMGRIGEVIRDKRVLRLIGKYLRCGAMVEGVVIASEEGTPQGGPLSPLLANIYLDALDKELGSQRSLFQPICGRLQYLRWKRNGRQAGDGEHQRLD
jgi:RNA-directed DNA polymerase